MAFQSGGTAAGSSWTLNADGYVGTYITLAAPATVTLAVQASGQPGTGPAPLLGISVDNSEQHFSVSAAANTYTLTTTLPGWHALRVRTDLSNVLTGDNQSLTIQNLTVTGAALPIRTATPMRRSLPRTPTPPISAREMSRSHYRASPRALRSNSNWSATPSTLKAPSRAAVPPIPPRTWPPQIRPPDRRLRTIRNFFNANFNTLEPSNAGKWSNNEPFQNFTTMSYVDTLLTYAHTNNMNVRMHNLIWGNQQPTWVNTLLTNAQSANPTTAANAKSQLMTAIANRITYYIGTSGDRSDKYQELDVLNEALRTPPYWKIFGASGIAQIYNMAANAAAAAGNPNLRLYTNEYNVLQFSTNPTTGVQDPYANWYRQNVEDIQNALAGKPTVSGIGIQYYADSTLANHSPARIMQTLENLSVTGLPLSLPNSR